MLSPHSSCAKLPTPSPRPQNHSITLQSLPQIKAAPSLPLLSLITFEREEPLSSSSPSRMFLSRPTRSYFRKETAQPGSQYRSSIMLGLCWRVNQEKETQGRESQCTGGCDDSQCGEKLRKKQAGGAKERTTRSTTHQSKEPRKQERRVCWRRQTLILET